MLSGSIVNVEFSDTLSRSMTLLSDKKVGSQFCGCALLVLRHGSFVDVDRDRWRVIHEITCSGSSGLAGCPHAELRYDTGFAIINRLLCSISLGGFEVFSLSVAHFWTTHSGRAFMPSSTAVFGLCKTERDVLIVKLRVTDVQNGTGHRNPPRWLRIPSRRDRNFAGTGRFFGASGRNVADLKPIALFGPFPVRRGASEEHWEGLRKRLRKHVQPTLSCGSYAGELSACGE